ncbi:glucosamine-6-phosphate deaminase [Devosia lucknowensis]|uniref:Glucosamine-6-phosphate deaminase n=1 Tax=Devosia lucknowensis TaxID=1096929 RepID=A0A1Y6G5P9_9HYPH|nr:glucosamine-6-phosphate deaminase [Devosia lucknowensis]SMQ85396.1 glucosamine-6-phosphate deaminase [Devosia lucknowensis]
MELKIHENGDELGRHAAEDGAAAINHAIARAGQATIIVATGASQFAMLDALVGHDIDWSRVAAFHLDEYVGLPATHRASFRGYLRTRFVDRVKGLREFVEVGGDAADLGEEVARLNARLADETVDVCFAGIGENCHLAFNDPPADFAIEDPYIVVDLDAACRQQQFGEGWFDSIEAVPARAISMSIRQIMKSRKIVLSVPDQRKALAVRQAVQQPVSPLHPASILQRHPNATLHLDRASASMLE